MTPSTIPEVLILLIVTSASLQSVPGGNGEQVANATAASGATGESGEVS